MRMCLTALLILALFLGHAHLADASKGSAPSVARSPSPSVRSSGGSSYASGSKSYSAPAAKTYSSGGSSYSAPAAKTAGSGSGAVKTGTSSASAKTYSSGGSTGKTASTPSPAKVATSGGSANKTGTTSAPAKVYSSGSTGARTGTTSAPAKTYSSSGSGSSSSSSAAKIYSSGAGKISYSSPAGKGYSSGGGGSGQTGAPSAAQPPSSAKPVVAYDKLAAADQKKAESRAAYVKAQEPKTTYTPPKGNPKPIDPRDQKIEQLRSQLDNERWANRDLRERSFYTVYYTRPVIGYYSDPYSNFFWLWMLDRSLDDRAYWAYHHRYDMDGARYQYLLAKDAQLQARIQQLEAQNVARNRAYIPPGLQDDPDLMYTDDYVSAVYNPQPTVLTNPQPPAVVYQDDSYRPSSYGGGYSGNSSGSGSGRVLFTIFLVLMIGCFIWLGVWLVFCKRWNI